MKKNNNKTTKTRQKDVARRRNEGGKKRKKRVNHKNRDLKQRVRKEYENRRRTEGKEKKVQRDGVRLASLPAVGEERPGFPTVASTPPSTPLLYFYSSRMPNNFLKPCVMFLPGNRAHTQHTPHTHTINSWNN